jgi:hypothetical protein
VSFGSPGSRRSVRWTQWASGSSRLAPGLAFEQESPWSRTGRVRSRGVVSPGQRCIQVGTLCLAFQRCFSRPCCRAPLVVPFVALRICTRSSNTEALAAHWSDFFIVSPGGEPPWLGRQPHSFLSHCPALLVPSRQAVFYEEAYLAFPVAARLASYSPGIGGLGTYHIVLWVNAFKL